jgi:hypothetical protein
MNEAAFYADFMYTSLFVIHLRNLSDSIKIKWDSSLTKVGSGRYFQNTHP